MKLNLACGKNILEGWENHDKEVDLRERLPWADCVANFILLEHGIEHLTSDRVVGMLREFRRVLKPGGVVRIAFPDSERLAAFTDEEFEQYAKAMRAAGVPPFDLNGYICLIFAAWGHRTAWTKNLLMTLLRACGFEARASTYGESLAPELCCVEGHHKLAGFAAVLETSVVEGVKT